MSFEVFRTLYWKDIFVWKMRLCIRHKFSYVSEQIGVYIVGAELCPFTLSTKEENFHKTTWQDVPPPNPRIYSSYSTIYIAKLLKLIYAAKN